MRWISTKIIYMIVLVAIFLFFSPYIVYLFQCHIEYTKIHDWNTCRTDQLVDVCIPERWDREVLLCMGNKLPPQ